MRSGKVLLTLLAAVLIVAVSAVVVSCGSSDSGSAGVPDYKWSQTTEAITLPSFVYDPSAPTGAATAYRFALERPDLLKQIPCYCGCGQEAGHKNNLDCFVQSRNGNQVAFDNHGAG